MPDEDWEKKPERGRYITCYLSFSATEIDFRYSDFEIAVDGVICYTEEKERSSGQIKLRVLLPTEEMVQVIIYKAPCGGGYGINIDRYNNLSGNFTITIKEKIPIYFPIDDNYLVSKLSVFTVELDDSDIINVPLNFRNGIIFCVTKKILIIITAPVSMQSILAQTCTMTRRDPCALYQMERLLKVPQFYFPPVLLSMWMVIEHVI